MITFKEININEYKKLLDNIQHTYAKTFNNVELLNNFEENVNNKSSKISNPNINNNIIQHDDKKKYIFLNTHDYYNKNPKDILNYIKKYI